MNRSSGGRLSWGTESSRSNLLVQKCKSCGATRTPVWRYGSEGKAHPLCNACSLRKQRSSARQASFSQSLLVAWIASLLRFYTIQKGHWSFQTFPDGSFGPFCKPAICAFPAYPKSPEPDQALRPIGMHPHLMLNVITFVAGQKCLRHPFQTSCTILPKDLAWRAKESSALQSLSAQMTLDTPIPALHPASPRQRLSRPLTRRWCRTVWQGTWGPACTVSSRGKGAGFLEYLCHLLHKQCRPITTASVSGMGRFNYVDTFFGTCDFLLCTPYVWKACLLDVSTRIVHLRADHSNLTSCSVCSQDLGQAMVFTKGKSWNKMGSPEKAGELWHLCVRLFWLSSKSHTPSVIAHLACRSNAEPVYDSYQSGDTWWALVWLASHVWNEIWQLGLVQDLYAKAIQWWQPIPCGQNPQVILCIWPSREDLECWSIFCSLKQETDVALEGPSHQRPFSGPVRVSAS